jgi:hypothetical protein
MTFEEYLKHIDYQHFAMQPAEVIKRVLHMAWQASRENMQEYQKHEFCRDMNCSYLKKDKCELKPGCCNITSGSG